MSGPRAKILIVSVTQKSKPCKGHTSNNKHSAPNVTVTVACFSKDLYPGATTSPAKMVNVLTSDNPSETLEAQYITDPKAACVDVGTECESPWMDPNQTEIARNVDFGSCIANFGQGKGSDGLCGINGGFKVSFSSKDDIYKDLSYTLYEGS